MQIVAFGSFVDIEAGSSEFSLKVGYLGEEAVVAIPAETYQTLAAFFQQVREARAKAGAELNLQQLSVEPATPETAPSPSPLVSPYKPGEAPPKNGGLGDVTPEELALVDNILRERAAAQNFSLESMDEVALNGLRRNVLSSLRQKAAESLPAPAHILTAPPDKPVDEDGIESVV